MERHTEKYPRSSVREVCAKVSEELKKIKASVVFSWKVPTKLIVAAFQ